MSDADARTDCESFEAWLLDAPDSEGAAWRSHLEGCAACSEQWRTHRMLLAIFADQEVPEVSPAFQANLERKLRRDVRVEPLDGWRLAALTAYAVGAVGLLRWIFSYAPLPSIDLASPWVAGLALVSVPLTFGLAIAATRLLPSAPAKGTYPPRP